VRRTLAPALALAVIAALGGCGDASESDADEAGSATGLTSQQQRMVEQGAARYATWVRAQTDQLLDGTDRFVVAVKAGNDDLARLIYPEARSHWEAVEPVAETFGDLDPKTDAREADLAEGEAWTGWHALEKDLWPQDAEAGYAPLTDEQRAELADRLRSDLGQLRSEVAEKTYTGEEIAQGAKELLDEVANGKVTGEEELWSHTDLWDFQANVDGARKAYQVLRPVVAQTDPELAETLQDRFAELQGLLDQHREGAGFSSYEELTPDQVKALSDAVNALSEPLAQLAAAVSS
jgi:iron uptake system component EfeO